MSEITTGSGTFKTQVRFIDPTKDNSPLLAPSIGMTVGERFPIEMGMSPTISSISITADLLDPIPRLDLRIIDQTGMIMPRLDSGGRTGIAVLITELSFDKPSYVPSDLSSSGTIELDQKFLVYEIELVDQNTNLYSIKGIGYNSAQLLSRFVYSSGDEATDWFEILQGLMSTAGFSERWFDIPHGMKSGRKGRFITNASHNLMDSINWCMSKTLSPDFLTGLPIFRYRMLQRDYDVITLNRSIPMDSQAQIKNILFAKGRDAAPQQLMFNSLYETNMVGPEIPFEAFKPSKRIEYDHDEGFFVHETFGKEFYGSLFINGGDGMVPPIDPDYVPSAASRSNSTGAQKTKTLDDTRYPLNLILSRTVLYSNVVSGTVQASVVRDVGQVVILTTPSAVAGETKKSDFTAARHIGTYLINRIEHLISNNSYVNNIVASRMSVPEK